MTAAFNLVSQVLGGKLPPKILAYGLLNTLNRWMGTGHRRFEFERLYTEQSDPWDYRSSAYENAKYEKTLALILDHRRGNDAALEIGCSIGQFSGRLAGAFASVTSVDFSRQALKAAQEHNRAWKNLQFVHSPLQTLSLDKRFDVITCAEILYYIDKGQTEAVLSRLGEHLAPDGIIVTVADVPAGPVAEHYAAGWEEVLAERFHLAANEVVEDPFRPYRICVFRRRAEA